MPQMAPYNWLMLFMLFNLIIMMISSINYYLYMYKSKKKIKFNNYIKYNFTW